MFLVFFRASSIVCHLLTPDFVFAVSFFVACQMALLQTDAEQIRTFNVAVAKAMNRAKQNHSQITVKPIQSDNYLVQQIHASQMDWHRIGIGHKMLVSFFFCTLLASPIWITECFPGILCALKTNAFLIPTAVRLNACILQNCAKTILTAERGAF